MYSAINSLLKNGQTPFYFYDLNLLESTLTEIKKQSSKYDFKIHYAIKANYNLPILKLIKKHNFGVDCVSANEIRMAKKVGFVMNDVVFAGVGKTDEEIIYGISNNIFSFNSESIEELEVINSWAKKMETKANISLRINPNINSDTHKYLTTGTSENKFGINESEFELLLKKLTNLKNISVIGLHFHIGSQITNMNVYKELCQKANQINDYFEEKGIKIKHLNMGGGLGIDYENPDKHLVPDFESYFKIFAQNLKPKTGQKVHFELGRSVVGQCGNLITKVLYVKTGETKKFAVVDAGMTDLIRPALYNSFHKIESLKYAKDEDFYEIVGPICETSDFLGKNIALPKTVRGDFLIVKSTGAYGQAMNTHYNLRKTTNAYYFYKDKIWTNNNQLKNKINKGIKIPIAT